MTSTRRGPRSILLGLLGVLTVAAAVLVGQPDAAAHSDLTGSSPTADSSSRAPQEIRLTFSDDVEPSFAAVTLAVDEAEPTKLRSQVAGSLVRATTPANAADDTPQQWRVAYRVVSQDGHPITGSISFTVTPAAISTGPSASSGVDSATAPPTPATSPTAGASATPSAAPPAATVPPGFPPASDRHGERGWFIIAVMAATLLLVPAAAGIFSFLPSHDPYAQPDLGDGLAAEATDPPTDPDAPSHAPGDDAPHDGAAADGTGSDVTGSDATGPVPADGGAAEPLRTGDPGRERPPAT